MARYVTCDVFTDCAYGGNPLAVVLDAADLTTAQMQAIAAEFHYSETTFVLPPVRAGDSARVRIFTPRVEVPFAGHPNVGTAVVLAREIERAGGRTGERLRFDEAAGPVDVRLWRRDGTVVGADITAPQPLTLGTPVAAADAAACLGLPTQAILTRVHAPRVASVGLAFLIVELASRADLARARPLLEAHERILPPAGTDAVYAYVRGAAAGEIEARMFSPLDSTPEDPATGSASAATIAMLAALEGIDGDREWRLRQGADMGRPSLLHGRTRTRGGIVSEVGIGGEVVVIMRGAIERLPPVAS